MCKFGHIPHVLIFPASQDIFWRKIVLCIGFAKLFRKKIIPDQACRNGGYP